MSKKNTDALVIGFAMFSMFFGAGNLIFPPFLGKISGQSWILSGLGFVITGVGITMTGLYTTVYFDGNVDALGEKISPIFAKILGTMCIVAIGPLFCIPRVAATTYKISIVPIFGSKIPPIALSTVFFAISLYFVLGENTMMDRIGKYLTPALLFMIFLIVIKAVINPEKSFAIIEGEKFFLGGFNEGYQTMDALGSMFIGGIACETLLNKGYKKENQRKSMATKSVIIAGISLAFVYLGLCFAGASLSDKIVDTDRTKVLMSMVRILWGDFGMIAIGTAMFLACITTSIGLTSTCANYFSALIGGKISRRNFAIMISIFSCFVSTAGLNRLIAIAVPILSTLYPVIIILMIGCLFDKYISNKSYYKGLVLATLIISLTQTLSGIFKDNLLLKQANDMIVSLPFSDVGVPYLLPAIICGGIFAVIVKDNNKLSNVI